MATTHLQNLPFNEFMQDANGADTYDANKAIFTHLPAGLHFVITHDAAMAARNHSDWTCDLADFGKIDGASAYINMDANTAAQNSGFKFRLTDLEITKMLAINYTVMIDAGLDTQDAWVVAALRCRWFQLGGLQYAMAGLHGLQAEHIILNTQGKGSSNAVEAIAKATSNGAVETAMGANAATFAAEWTSADHGFKWVIKHAENIWAAVECVFKLRGHHMKEGGNEEASFVSLYNRILKASYEGNFEFPPKVSLIHLFRTSIHCFLIEALPKITAKFIAYNKVGAATVIRLSSGPCGCAQVTTAAAALDTMSGEVWYSKFEKVYKTQVETAISAKDVILDDKYSYHIAAPLYGMAKKASVNVGSKAITMSEVISTIQNVGAACQGLIYALDAAKKNQFISSYALENAQALKKASNATPLLSMRVKQIIEASIDEINEAKTAKEAINAAFPNMASGAAVSTNTSAAAGNTVNQAATGINP